MSEVSAKAARLIGAHLDGPKAPRRCDVSIPARFGFRPCLSRNPTSPMPNLQPKRISGRDNPEFQRIRAVRARKNRDLILVEGPKLLSEAVRSRLSIDLIAVDASNRESREEGLAFGAMSRVFVELSDSLMKSLSDVETTQGLIALVGRPRFANDWLRREDALVLLLDGLQDPGNVGALFRTAEAAGVCGILLTRGCADPLAPKALRASAGSAFRVPHLSDLSVDAILSLVPSGLEVVAATVGSGALPVFDQVLRLPLALALGSEGAGLSAGLEAAASRRVRIPQAGQVESLNVAVAGSIIVFEIARQAGSLR